MIPKKIHYCWFGPKPYPKLVKNCIKSWQERLPDYELCFWNETNSPIEKSFVRQAYSAGKYAFMSDYVRFWVLYNHGGIYLDTDMFVIKPFDDLLDNKVFVGWETNDKEKVNCAIIASIPKHSFIRDVLAYYEELSFSKDLIPSLVVPSILTTLYHKYPNKQEIAIFPYSYFYPLPYEQKENSSNFLNYVTPETYSVHLWNISWGSWRAKFKERLLYYYNSLCRGINF